MSYKIQPPRIYNIFDIKREIKKTAAVPLRTAILSLISSNSEHEQIELVKVLYIHIFSIGYDSN
ncbi:MAG: hypothetical protein ACJ72Q_06710 [Nitrososphaeraceae archaeon]